MTTKHLRELVSSDQFHVSFVTLAMLRSLALRRRYYNMPVTTRIKKGDTVKLISGAQKGTTA